MRPVADDLALVDLQRVGLDEVEGDRRTRAQLVERRNAAPVALDRDDVGAGIEQRAGQPAGSGADFVDALRREIAGNRRDPGQQLAVEDEILAERLARAEAVPRDDLAQRLGRDGSGASARSAALSAAIRIAAAIGRGSARSWPAMSNAVPWSGAVRTIGRPSVTLTASSKWSALIGISAWSWYMHSAAS